MSKKMKRIGWVVEDKYDPTDTWFCDVGIIRRTKSKAIGNYGRSWYNINRRKGLARCSPVYVEVTDGKFS